MKEVNEILIDKQLIFSQCRVDKELWILLDYAKNDIQMYTNGTEDAQKVKFNFVKVAMKYGIVSSAKEFWKRIIDVSIKENKDKVLNDNYIIRYEFEVK